MTDKDTYHINELISKLENIRNDVVDPLDIMKTLHTIAKEIGKIKFHQECLMELLPDKFRMLNPDEWEHINKKKKIEGKWVDQDLFEDCK